METSTLAFVFFIIFYFVLAKNELKWALILLLAGLPLYQIRFVVAGLPLTVLEIMILVAFFVWFVFYTKFLDIVRGRYSWQDVKENRRRREPYPFAWEIICLLFISYGAAALAGFTNEALGIWKAYFYEPVLVFILALNVFQYAPAFAKRLAGQAGGSADKNAASKAEPDLGQPELVSASFILWPLAASAFLISLIAILQSLGLINSPVNFWPRVTGPFFYPNALGLFLGPLTLVMFGWLMKDFRFAISDLRAKNYKNLFLIFTILLSITAIFLARSEGALVGIAAGLVVFAGLWFFSCSKRGQFVPIVAASTIMILIVYSSFIFLKLPEYKYLNSGIPALDKAADKIMLNDLSGEIRKQQWRETWQMLKENKRWFFGVGLSGYQEAIAPYHQAGIFFNRNRDPRFYNELVWGPEEYKAKHWQPVETYLYPHNIFLNFWTELGAPGAILFIWIIAKFFFIGVSQFKRGCELRGGRAYKYLNFGLISAMTAILVHGIVDVPYFKNDLSVTFWVLLALMSILKLETDSRKKNNQHENSPAKIYR